MQKYLVESEFYGGPLDGKIKSSFGEGESGIHSVEPIGWLDAEGKICNEDQAVYVLCGCFTLPHQGHEKCRFRYRYRGVSFGPEVFTDVMP